MLIKNIRVYFIHKQCDYLIILSLLSKYQLMSLQRMRNFVVVIDSNLSYIPYSTKHHYIMTSLLLVKILNKPSDHVNINYIRCKVTKKMEFLVLITFAFADLSDDNWDQNI